MVLYNNFTCMEKKWQRFSQTLILQLSWYYDYDVHSQVAAKNEEEG